jgi:hypothetical protein
MAFLPGLGGSLCHPCFVNPAMASPPRLLSQCAVLPAVCVFRPYDAKPIVVRGCQGCEAERSTTGAKRKEPGLDAGAHGDYLAWPSKDGKPQRPDAGQGSGSRAAPTPEASETLPGHEKPSTAPVSAVHSPVSKRPIEQQPASVWQGFGGAETPKGAPDHASPARRECARAARAAPVCNFPDSAAVFFPDSLAE